MAKELTRLKNSLNDNRSILELCVSLRITPQDCFKLLLTYLFYELQNGIERFPFADLEYLFEIINGFSDELDFKLCDKLVRKFKNKVEGKMLITKERHSFYKLNRLNEQLSLLEQSIKAFESKTQSYAYIHYLLFHKRNYPLVKKVLERNPKLLNCKDLNDKHIFFHLLDHYIEEVGKIKEYDGVTFLVNYYHSLIAFFLKEESLDISSKEVTKYLEALDDKLPIHVYYEVLTNLKSMFEEGKYRFLGIKYQGGLEEYLDTIKEEDSIYDFTDEFTITLDSENAYFLDDALTIKRLRNGNILLLVHVADVISAYLEEKDMSQLLEEKFAYGPKHLKRRCSLGGQNEHGVVSHAYEIDLDGNLVNAKIMRGKIIPDVNLRFSYVNPILNDDYDNELTDSLKLFVYLTEKTTNLQYGEGAFRNINLGNRIVERMMVFTSHFVARCSELAGYPFLYKVQEGTDLERFHVYHPDQKRLESALTKDVKLITRELKRQNTAYYTTDNIGYYKRGLSVYCHVTSPIIEQESKITQGLERSFLIDEEDGEDLVEAWHNFLTEYVENKQNAKTKSLKRPCQDDESML